MGGGAGGAARYSAAESHSGKGNWAGAGTAVQLEGTRQRNVARKLLVALKVDFFSFPGNPARMCPSCHTEFVRQVRLPSCYSLPSPRPHQAGLFCTST